MLRCAMQRHCGREMAFHTHSQFYGINLHSDGTKTQCIIKSRQHIHGCWFAWKVWCCASRLHLYTLYNTFCASKITLNHLVIFCMKLRDYFCNVGWWCRDKIINPDEKRAEELRKSSVLKECKRSLENAVSRWKSNFQWLVTENPSGCKLPL